MSDKDGCKCRPKLTMVVVFLESLRQLCFKASTDGYWSPNNLAFCHKATSRQYFAFSCIETLFSRHRFSSSWTPPMGSTSMLSLSTGGTCCPPFPSSGTTRPLWPSRPCSRSRLCIFCCNPKLHFSCSLFWKIRHSPLGFDRAKVRQRKPSKSPCILSGKYQL